jgi:hypothetical protein
MACSRLTSNYDVAENLYCLSEETLSLSSNNANYVNEGNCKLLLVAPAIAPETAESRKHPTGASGWLHGWNSLWKTWEINMEFTGASSPVEVWVQRFVLMRRN